MFLILMDQVMFMKICYLSGTIFLSKLHALRRERMLILGQRENSPDALVRCSCL